MTDSLAIAIRSLGLPSDAATGLKQAVGFSRSLQPGERLAAQGDRSPGVHIVLAGIIKSCRNLDNGAAQTLAVFTAGEMLGIQGAALGHEAASLAAVSNARVALIPTAKLHALQLVYPSLTDALWRAMAREAAILQEWMLGMGRRSALSQMAHLLCELALRMRLAGRVVGNLYDLSLTQTELADALGLSPVHVNRVLQTLRAEGMIEFRRGRLRIGDWRRLITIADFDPTYLRLRAQPGDGHASLLFSSGDSERAGNGRDRQPLS